jgi:hypothetical protein
VAVANFSWVRGVEVPETSAADVAIDLMSQPYQMVGSLWRISLGKRKMLDRDDQEVIKDAKDGGAVLVTWDRVVREAAGGLTPYEVLEGAKEEGQGTPEAQAEISRLHSLSPRDLTVLGEAADKTYKLFEEKIQVDEDTAKLIRILRIQKEYSWRAIARHCSDFLKAPFGGNQLAGMVICEKAAKLLGEDFLQPPWN